MRRQALPDPATGLTGDEQLARVTAPRSESGFRHGAARARPRFLATLVVSLPRVEGEVPTVPSELSGRTGESQPRESLWNRKVLYQWVPSLFLQLFSNLNTCTDVMIESGFFSFRFLPGPVACGSCPTGG